MFKFGTKWDKVIGKHSNLVVYVVILSECVHGNSVAFLRDALLVGHV